MLKKIKIFIQVNIGNENQKSGVDKDELEKLVVFCKEINLTVLGLMCIPPANEDPNKYFEEMRQLNKSFGFNELSMGMSSDYLTAIKYALYLKLKLINYQKMNYLLLPK